MKIWNGLPGCLYACGKYLKVVYLSDIMVIKMCIRVNSCGEAVWLCIGLNIWVVKNSDDQNHVIMREYLGALLLRLYCAYLACFLLYCCLTSI